MWCWWRRVVAVGAAVAFVGTGCGNGAPEGRADPSSQAIAISGEGHEVHLYRVATDGEALWLTDERVPVLYRYDLETGTVEETELNTQGTWSPSGEPSDISVAVGDGVVWVADPCKQCPVGDVYKVRDGVAERWVTSLPEPFWLAWVREGLWVSSFANNEVVALEPGSGTIVRRVSVDGPSGVVEAFDRVWMVGSHGNNVVVRDPASDSEGPAVSLGSPMRLNPEHVTATSDAIWVNNPAGTVFRINPDTYEVVPFAVPDPTEIEGGGEVVWVGSRRGLYRLAGDGQLEHWDMPEISGLAVTDTAVFAVEMGSDTIHRVER